MGAIMVAQRNEPLAVLLFCKAMEQEQTLRSLAEGIGLGPVSLRQIMTGETRRPRAKSLTLLSSLLGLSIEDVRHSYAQVFMPAPKFCVWLTARVSGRIPRAKITRDTEISDSALRNYLSGRTLPDAHQAVRLAESLGVDPLVLARMIMADMVRRDTGIAIPEAEVIDEAPPVAANQPAEAEFEEEEAPPPIVVPPTMPSLLPPIAASPLVVPTMESPSIEVSRTYDEDHLLSLWRRLHPQGRRATLIYIAGLLAEG